MGRNHVDHFVVRVPYHKSCLARDEGKGVGQGHQHRFDAQPCRVTV